MKNKITEQFISVGDLSIGMSDNIIPFVDTFADTSLKLFLEDGSILELEFIDSQALKYTRAETDDSRYSVICGYSANSPRKDIYFIDFVVSYGCTTSVSVILDAAQQIATIITAVLPNAEEMKIPLIQRAKSDLPLSSVNLSVTHASVGIPFGSSTKKHEETTELVGKRMVFHYSSTGVYEHIYLNKHFYTWHCIQGNEEGLADTDLCFYYKLAENLYCFIWIEKIIPTLGIVLEDLDVMRSYGKLYGYETYETGKVSNFAVGSFASLLNQTEYDLK
ncbi:MoaF C-terminal domain-containing protein [Lacrimispora sp. JR3]|uniref:MoaF C-terminal domain-containing protein n=1 Tax=Lacrimispora sinapis TaxID=3111456 RepID=UPI00374A92BB